MAFGLISHSDCVRHPVPIQHPEKPARITVIQDQLIAQGLDVLMPYTEAPFATPEQLERVHSANHLKHMFSLAESDEEHWLDQDTCFTSETLAAARRAAGACVKAVDLVMESQVRHQFCLVRPPGHHADRDHASGFCIFNNIAVGAAHALEAHGLERIAITDFDVHHGNGTESIFRDDPRVLFCSVFQHPFYPDIPFESSNDHIVNVPLPAYTSGPQFREAISNQWLPALEAFRPQLILVSAGFDGHTSDDMSQFMLVNEDFAWLGEQLTRIAETHADNRLIATLEGGYNLDTLAGSVLAFLNEYWKS
jgi:acetoin utilization deacetylase AcuC-like enzyme